MENLWSPWRIKYILDNKPQGCVFCEAFAADPAQDREYLIVHRGAHCGVLMNLYPYNNGHLMVIPYVHTSTFEGLAPDALTEAMTLSNACVRALRRAMNPEGFNIGINLGKAAGAGIDAHVHMHVVPRWSGDTNFMTTLGGIRCIPESLQQTYDKITAVWEGIDG
ncbi:MAG: HIT domain-containing protein [Anaerolineae bacterium]|nr:HIT domain-containing protein [Anaerolineae bacterium]